MGWSGEPSTSELKTRSAISPWGAYLSIMEHGVLAGIKDPQVMQYALVVSYVNGAGAAADILIRPEKGDRQD
jgi:membrane-bound lytic murein transglycosylase E